MDLLEQWSSEAEGSGDQEASQALSEAADAVRGLKEKS